MRRYLLSCLLASIMATSVASAAPSSGLGLDIAAVVNDEVISSYDVDSRVKFVIATTKLANTAEVRQGIRPQIIRLLIDERLQLADAKRNDITINEKEVTSAIASIEKQRSMSEGSIYRLLEREGVPRETLTDQIHAQLAWNALIVRKVRPRVKVSEDEVKLSHIQPPQAAKKQELQIGIMVLMVDKPSRDAEIKKLAQRLYGEIRGGASFEEIYRQFSGTGGKPDTFWVKPEQLDPAIARALAGAQAGMITMPVRNNNNYTIIKVYDSRSLEQEKPKEIEVQFKEILLKLKEDADQKEAGVLLQIGEEVAKHPGTCEEKGVANIENLGDFDIAVELKRSRISELPPAIKIIAENLKVGDISTPFATSEGIRLYMLCDKKEALPETMDMDRMTNLLFQKKIELEAEKYMRNLRREAFVEIRQ